MIKETKVVTETTNRQKFCDVCGSETLTSHSTRCQICDKDLCEDCIGHEIYEFGDYRTVYCANCWTIGEPYRQKINEHELIIEQLNNEWENKCKQDEK